MTKTELKKWLEEHYGRGQRLAFVTDYNAMAEDMGDAPITLDALENWLYRQPPQRLEQTLDLVLAWREQSKPIVKTYTVNIELTAERLEIIKQMAGDGVYAPEVYLRAMVDRALEREIKGHLAAIKAAQKRRPGRPTQATLVRPPIESPPPANGARRPKPNRPRRKDGDK